MLAEVAGEKGLDVERPRRDNHEIHPVAGYVDAWQLVRNLIDLRDDNA